MNKRRKLALLVIEGDKNFEKTHDVIPVNWQAFHVIEILYSFQEKEGYRTAIYAE